MHIDRPVPSPAYLVLLAVATLAGGLPLYLNLGQHPSSPYLVLACLPLLLMLALDISAFFTRYRIEDGNFVATAWPIFRKTVPLADIQDVQRVGMIRRVLGWAPGVAGCCNRLSNGLQLILPRGVLYISPSNLEEMEKLLQHGRKMRG